MLLNAYWVSRNSNDLDSIEDRSCGIDTTDQSHYAECSVYGEVGLYRSGGNQPPVMLRETCPDHDIIIAMVDTPFNVDFWNVTEEERFTLHWDGSGWSTAEEVDFNDGKWVELRSVDVESMLLKPLHELGLNYITQNMVKDRTLLVELVDRQDWDTSCLTNVEEFHVAGGYFYIDDDSNDAKYTTDFKNIPDVSELEVLHYVDPTSAKDDYIKIFFDDEITIDRALKKLYSIGKSRPDTFHLIESISTSVDVADMKELAKDLTLDNPLDVMYFIVKNPEGLHRLYFNMSFWFPIEASYLS